jgi:serine/threonine protein kinase/tetratricopeptide (TPR) repeat protein
MAVDLKRVQTVFMTVLEQPDPAGRTEVLDRECVGDTELRSRVETLLTALGEPDSLLVDTPAPGVELRSTVIMDRPPPPLIAEGPGSHIGPYKLLQKLGEGGMGAVYMAEQEKPVRRRVALKIIKPGMDSEQVIARFEAERQALALMEHQNIARVLDAGTTDTGRPYFVMELVHGVPITEYCDQVQLSPTERLELFVPVCQAIQHAHQKGIIHRDIKPSNVLVTLYDGKPVPKVIDFGVAKAIDQTLTERTMFTQYGAIVGTLEYMSPEQAEMSALGVDTRSDIYSLGVLLYELLTGTTPLEHQKLCGAAYAEILKRIKDEDPPRPSTRLSSSKETLPAICAQRKTEPARLRKLVRGELDWIVMKALEKDRTRRYETAGGLARDVERFLSGDAVEACPPSAGYRLRKFARKHRAALASAAAFAVLLVLGAVVSTYEAIRATRAERQARAEAVRAIDAETRARRQRDRAVDAEHRTAAQRDRAVLAEVQAKAEGEKARRSAAESLAVLSFFENQVLAAARPEGQAGGLGRNVTIRHALDAAEPKIALAFQQQPLVEASVRTVLGSTYHFLGESARAIGQLERALEIRKAKLEPGHPDTLTAQNNLAMAYQSSGRWDTAIPLLEQTLATRTTRLGATHPDSLTTQHDLARAYQANGRWDRAIPLLEQTLATRTAKLGAEHPDTLTSQHDLARAYQANGRWDKSIPLLEQTLATRKARLGAEHPDTLTSQNDLALAYQADGRWHQSIPLLEQTLAMRIARLGPEHPDTLASQNGLALAYHEAGQSSRALPLLEQTLAARTAKLGAGHPDTLLTQDILANGYKAAGQWDRAIPLFERTLATQTSRLGADHPSALTCQNNLALAFRDAGQWDRAIPLFERTLAVETARLGPDHPNALLTQNNLALTLRDDGQWDRATTLFERTLAIRSAKLGPDHPDTLLTQQNLAMAYRLLGRWDRAIPLFERTLATQTARLGADHPTTLLTQNNLGPAYVAVGKVDRAIALLEKTLAGRMAKLGAGHPTTFTSQNNLALAYQAAGELDRAIALFEQTLAARTSRLGADHPSTLTTRFDLASAYQARGDSGRAEPMLRDVLAARRKKLGSIHPDVAQTLCALSSSLLKQHKWAEAESLLREALSIWGATRPDDWLRFKTESRLGECLLGQKRYAEAEPMLLSGYNGMKAREARIPMQEKLRLAEAGQLVAELYKVWGKPEKVREWESKRAATSSGGGRKP